MARTKSDVKTPIQLKKELTEARKTIEQLNSSLEGKNEIIEGLEHEKKEHIGLVKKYKAMSRLYKGDLVMINNQRNSLMVSVVEMKNTTPVHAAQIADKVLSECKPLKYYTNEEIEQMIVGTPLYDNAAPASMLRKLFNS